MSKGASKKRDGARGTQAAAQAFYVYCIGERDQLAPLFAETLPAPIENSAGLEAVAGGALAAVVSAVPLSDYSEQTLPERLADVEWTATRALRHERAVEFFARRAGVIPLRFGTIYLTRERIAQLLEDRHVEFQAIIERLGGCEEWGLNVYTDRAQLKEAIASVSPRLREWTARAAALPPGQAYLLRKKIDALRADEARVEARRIVAGIESELAAASETAAVRLRHVKNEASEHGELAAKLAFLVRRARFAEFRAAAEKIAESCAPVGFRMELTGPWPPYNFAGAGAQDMSVDGQDEKK